MSWHSLGLVLCQIMAERGNEKCVVLRRRREQRRTLLCDNLLSQQCGQSNEIHLTLKGANLVSQTLKKDTSLFVRWCHNCLALGTAPLKDPSTVNTNTVGTEFQNLNLCGTNHVHSITLSQWYTWKAKKNPILFLIKIAL